MEVDEATAGLSVVDETDKEIEQDEEHVEDIPNDNHDVVGQGAVYELVQQPNDSDYVSKFTIQEKISFFMCIFTACDIYDVYNPTVDCIVCV